jgi:SAM-dependent methyltransferase
MTDQLTTRQFWLDYWEAKEGLAFEVPDQYPFVALLDSLAQRYQLKNLLEIGGFPGYFSVWATRRLGLQTTLLDYVVHPQILQELEQKNHLPANSVGVIEADLFAYQASPTYDLVVSNGLIEHFQDTQQILSKHADFLRPGGILLVTLPNFHSLNGWFQKTFDKENYDKHHIACMDLGLLRQTCEHLGLREVSVRYEGGFMIWFENEAQKPWYARLLKTVLWLPLKVFFKIVPVETRAFSPYIVLTAQK